MSLAARLKGKIKSRCTVFFRTEEVLFSLSFPLFSLLVEREEEQASQEDPEVQISQPQSKFTVKLTFCSARRDS